MLCKFSSSALLFRFLFAIERYQHKIVDDTRQHDGDDTRPFFGETYIYKEMQETDLNKIVDQSSKQETTCILDVRACTEGIETGQQIVANHLNTKSQRKSERYLDAHIGIETLKERQEQIVDTILQCRFECTNAYETDCRTIFRRQTPCKSLQIIMNEEL